ncbi:MAG TPA: protein translocase subunit SecD [Gaiellaceae bacterium]
MRRYLVILLALLAAVAGVVVLAFFRSPVLGLDLQGGLEVVLQAKAPQGREITQDDLDRSIEIMRQRIDKIGVSEPVITRQGTDQISVELAGVHDAARAAQIIGQTAQLQFFDLQGDALPPTLGANGQITASEQLLPLLSGQQAAAKTGTPTQWYLYKDKKRLAGPAESKDEILKQFGGKQPEGSKFYAVPQGKIVLTCTDNATVCPGVGVPAPGATYYYLFKYQPNNSEHPIPELTGNDLKGNEVRQDFGQGNQPIVLLGFTSSGADKFHDITRTLSQRGLTQANLAGATGAQREAYKQSFAIVLDGEIRSFPSIDFDDPSLRDGISGGQAEITGLDSVQEAKDLALVLQTGALPVEFVQVERSDISATLGSDSLHQALIAGIGGLLAVAFFLLLFYRFLGVVAIIGLGIYGVLLYGALLLFNVTLTLPGFAGLVLTIGVAADANVVIFERIKEEVRSGKSVRAAIASGYRKGFNTIVDANVVTVITAFVLFAVATGGVKGFALMLIIGTLISMITAVAATRALLGLIGGFRWFNNPAFMGASAQKIPSWQRVDFIGRTKYWFAVSGAVLLIGIGSLAVQGLNLGIDFKGGSQFSFKTPEPHQISDIRAQTAAMGLGDAVIQGRGPSTNGAYEEFQVRTESLGQEQQSNLTARLTSDLQATSVGVKNVSASFSRQILKSALLAIIVSLALIVIYVTLRFEFKFAVPVLVALVHDILITLGIYSLTQREVTSATVAAVLTILGYSIYDTIIIFDRVRENIPLMRRSSFAAIANQSLWETIRRSLATTFITLLPVSSLIVFGGDTLKDFAFALLVGILSGAYSTIFIATPLLVILKEREPEFAKRKAAGLREKLGALDVPEEQEEAAPVAEEPVAEPEPVAAAAPADGPAEPDGAKTAAERREARRKRRRARPHGRAR